MARLTSEPSTATSIASELLSKREAAMNKLSVFALAGTSMALALSYQQQGAAPAQAQPPGAAGPQNADAAARGGAPGGGGGFGIFGRGGGGWLTGRGDAQRTGWVRTDSFISVEKLQKPGFGIEWKRKLETTPRQGNSLSAGLGGNGSTLNPPPVIVTGSDNKVFGV